MSKYTYKIGTNLFLSAGGIKPKPVGVILFAGKEVARTQGYASERGAKTGAEKLCRRYQAYFERTGRRWDAEQKEIADHKRAAKLAEREARERVRVAAPDLLAAVREIHRVAEAHYPCAGCTCRDLARAALAQVEAQ